MRFINKATRGKTGRVKSLDERDFRSMPAYQPGAVPPDESGNRSKGRLSFLFCERAEKSSGFRPNWIPVFRTKNKAAATRCLVCSCYVCLLPTMISATVFMMPIGRTISAVIIMIIIRPRIASESELDHGRSDDHWGGRVDRRRCHIDLRRLNVHRRWRSNHYRRGRGNSKAETDACLRGSRGSE